MTGRVVLQPKYAGDKLSILFDFTGQIAAFAPAETIASQVTTCTVYSGTDPSPSAVISGTGSIAGPLVRQDVTAGVEGVIYSLRAEATTSGSHILVLTALLAVYPAQV